ncbi:hypothetical protein EV363DRAFT_1461066 [Boletus edulis]|nr:hypothetical protein EV363DRAFT_1461066 [Boletus edulis]
MANASVICTDKTGTFTQNTVTVVAGSIGIHEKFVRQPKHNQSRTDVVDERRFRRSTDRGILDTPQDLSVDQCRIDAVLSPQLRKLFNAAVAINTAFEDVDPATHQKIFIGSKTEGALADKPNPDIDLFDGSCWQTCWRRYRDVNTLRWILNFVIELNWPSYKQVRDAAEVIQVFPFSSGRKAMGIVVKLGDGCIKGAGEILAKSCVRHVVVSQDANQASDGDATVETTAIDTYAEANVLRTIIFYANLSLQTIVTCYRDFSIWPPLDVHLSGDKDVRCEDLAREQTLIGIVGVEDPHVKVFDRLLHIARKLCGIFTAGGIVMEGPIFRKLNDAEMLNTLPRQVLTRSSPEDKRILVEKLRSLGEIVAVIGDGTNDGPALKIAHIGSSMVLRWQRCSRRRRHGRQFFLDFPALHQCDCRCCYVCHGHRIVAGNLCSLAVQLLWINIIMDTFAALVLATDPASPALLDRKPDKLTSPLFTVDMHKQLFLQSAYQIVVTLIFHFFGLQILGLEATSKNDSVEQTVVLNIPVFAQIFNSSNSRRLDCKLNIFEGLLKNHYFVVITLIGNFIRCVFRSFCFIHNGESIPNLMNRGTVSGEKRSRQMIYRLSPSL